MKKITAILLACFLFIPVMSIEIPSTAKAAPSPYRALPNVKITVDGKPFVTEQPIYEYRGTTLVPMRPIFEKLGAELSWNKVTATVEAEKGNRKISLTIGNQTATIDGQLQELAVPPQLIDGGTYVPLRFVAQALSYELDWDPFERRITIVDTSSIDQMGKQKVYLSSAYLKNEYIRMEFGSDDTLQLKGSTSLENTAWTLAIRMPGTNQDVKSVYRLAVSEGKYDASVSLADIKDGKYTINVFFKNNTESVYRSYYWGIPIERQNGEFFFPISPIYKNNYVKAVKSTTLDPKEYLGMEALDQQEKEAIEQLAREIVAGEATDYGRLLMINDWVAENIYYDWDAYRTRTYGATDAYATLQSRKSVCQGYAELTNALLRSIGIPSRIVAGHAIWLSSQSWETVDHTVSDHAWNEAYVDGRWVIVDTTWNSGNKFENGEFKKGNVDHVYFDPTLEVFSLDHKMLR